MNVILKVIKLYKTPPLHGFVNFWLELQLVTIYQHYRKEHQKINEVTLNIRVMCRKLTKTWLFKVTKFHLLL